MIRTQTVIYTLFGGYLNPRGGEIGGREMVQLLRAFGLSENAVRLALSRMVRQGFLQSRKTGRKSIYSLTEKGNRMMGLGKEWAYGRKVHPWDGRWRLVVYNIPERFRPRRDELRTRLRTMGFGNLAGSTWISPYEIPSQLRKACAELKVEGYVETFEAGFTGGHKAKGLAARAWDLQGLENRYQAFIAKHTRQLAAWRKRKEVVVPKGQGFVEMFHADAEYVAIALEDPMLPPDLLPKDWAGLQAKRLVEECSREWMPEVWEFLKSVLQETKKG